MVSTAGDNNNKNKKKDAGTSKDFLSLEKYEFRYFLGAETGDVQEIKYLYEEIGVNINCWNTFGESPLHIACKYGQLDVVNYMLTKTNAKINSVDDKGNTPLHTTCSTPYGEFVDIVQALLEKNGIKINTTNNQCNTPEDLAYDNHYKQIQRLLQEEQNERHMHQCANFVLGLCIS